MFLKGLVTASLTKPFRNIIRIICNTLDHATCPCVHILNIENTFYNN
jgi:hypothetical protein